MKKILVVDDEPQIVSYIIRNLVKNNYLALGCYDGYKAIEMAHKEIPDLIIMDYKLSAGSGLNAYKGLKTSAITAAIPVIFISAYPLEKVKKEVMDMGAIAFFTKPFETEEFITCVNNFFKNKEDNKLPEKT